MKRYTIALILVFVLIMGALPAFALDTDLKVYDDAALFTEEEQELLMEKARRIAEDRRMDVVVVTADDTLGKSSMAYADDFYDYNGFGFGDEYDGVLLLIDMDNRVAWISTSGRAIGIFNDNRIDRILDKMEGHLRADDFYRAADVFLDEVDYYTAGGFRKAVRHIPIYLIISLAAAGISVAVMASYNKGRKTVTADTYLDHDSIRLRDNRDVYIRTAVTKRVISSSSGGGHGGSSTHVSSSGHTHGGGGRSF